MKKQLHNYAFIDSQNLNLSIRNQGWILNFRKYRQYLSRKYDISMAFIFIGYVPLESRFIYQLAERRIHFDS